MHEVLATPGNEAALVVVFDELDRLAPELGAGNGKRFGGHLREIESIGQRVAPA